MNNEHERKVELTISNNETFTFTLQDFILLKSLLDSNCYDMIEIFGEDAKKMQEYKQCLNLRKCVKSMIDEMLKRDWEDLEEELKN